MRKRPYGKDDNLVSIVIMIMSRGQDLVLIDWESFFRIDPIAPLKEP